MYDVAVEGHFYFIQVCKRSCKRQLGFFYF